jgi:hypothetical protein
MKTITITEQDVREALGPVTAYSPLGNALIFRLFINAKSISTNSFEKRIDALEKEIRKLLKGKKK